MGRTADAIAEGTSIAVAAARLTVRNDILVETISRGESYDFDQFMAFTADTLRALADEQDQAATTTEKLRKRARGRHSDPHGTHDYRDRDGRNLRKRIRQYRGVAKALRAMAEEPEALRGIVEEARDAAWHDVEANLVRRLNIEAQHPERDPDYAMMRDARMQSLQLIDLSRLAAHRKRLDAGAEQQG